MQNSNVNNDPTYSAAQAAHHNKTQQVDQQTPKAKLTEQQVLIVGGGHVGLSFALLLVYYAKNDGRIYWLLVRIKLGLVNK